MNKQPDRAAGDVNTLPNWVDNATDLCLTTMPDGDAFLLGIHDGDDPIADILYYIGNEYVIVKPGSMRDWYKEYMIQYFEDMGCATPTTEAHFLAAFTLGYIGVDKVVWTELDTKTVFNLLMREQVRQDECWCHAEPFKEDETALIVVAVKGDRVELVHQACNREDTYKLSYGFDCMRDILADYEGWLKDHPEADPKNKKD